MCQYRAESCESYDAALEKTYTHALDGARRDGLGVSQLDAHLIVLMTWKTEAKVVEMYAWITTVVLGLANGRAMLGPAASRRRRDNYPE